MAARDTVVAGATERMSRYRWLICALLFAATAMLIWRSPLLSMAFAVVGTALVRLI